MKTYEQITQKIRGLRKINAQEVFNTGKLLVEVRDRLKEDSPHAPYRSFSAYLETEFSDWARQHIYRYIQVYETFSKSVSNCGNIEGILQRFDPSALYLLAEKKTPIETRQEAIDRARYGERITRSIAKGIRQSHGVTTQRRYQYKIVEPMSANDAQRYLDELTKEVRFCEKTALTYKEGADLLSKSITERPKYEDLRSRQKKFEGRAQGLRMAIESFLKSGVSTVKPPVVEGLPDVNACEIESHEEIVYA
jgi:hypothetical protein